jgi:hypothetical protein
MPTCTRWFGANVGELAIVREIAISFGAEETIAAGDGTCGEAVSHFCNYAQAVTDIHESHVG